MEKSHDAVIESHDATPLWFSCFAWLLPAGILTQFLTAGLGLFLDPGLLGLHGAIGVSIALPTIGLLAGSLALMRLRGLAWLAAIVTALYGVQVVLAAGGAGLPLSLHPANGALLLCASLALLAKVERRRTRATLA
ncbi:DUF6220 domain-containing protein [Mesorhizobium sp. CAU 1741]|uniref:DUF6220 domain-containing protein n=1 Tax=Mesorhizobium sp. CAU 1741 TaxID=3140366 RepID=UPI00325C26C4